MDVMDREHTIEFLHKHVKTDMLMKHLFTVEAAMRGYAASTARIPTAGASPGCSTILTGKSARRRNRTPPSGRKFCGNTATRRILSGRC